MSAPRFACIVSNLWPRREETVCVCAQPNFISRDNFDTFQRRNLLEISNKELKKNP